MSWRACGPGSRRAVRRATSVRVLSPNRCGGSRDRKALRFLALVMFYSCHLRRELLLDWPDHPIHARAARTARSSQDWRVELAIARMRAEIDAVFCTRRDVSSAYHRLVSFALGSLAWRTTCHPLAWDTARVHQSGPGFRPHQRLVLCFSLGSRRS